MSITGFEDKRQITALLSCTMSGTLLPPKILYQGKTDQCHPNAQFPSDWDIFHTENHWSNEQSMHRFVDTIISPYINETREKHDLALKHPALSIFDCFAAHPVDKFLGKLEQSPVNQICKPIYSMHLTCVLKVLKFDVIQTNTTDVGTPHGAHVSNLSFIAAYSGARNFRVFITSDIFAAINFRGCTLTAKPANLNRAK